MATTTQQPFFRIQSFCMSILGTYLEKEKNNTWHRVRSTINCYMGYMLVLTQVYATQQSMGELEILCHLLGILVGIFLSAIKIRALHLQFKDFAELNHVLTELSQNVVLPNDREKLMRANKLGQTLSLINITCLITSSLTLILYPLAEPIYQFFVLEDRHSIIWPTPFGSVFPFDASYTPVYELVYVFMLYYFIIACFSINAMDSLFVEAALLIVCHFEFLQRDIESLNYENFDEDIRKVFAYHRRILEAKDALQRAYSVILPVFVIIAPTMFGLFVISALRSPGVTVIKSLGYSMSTLYQLFSYNYGGDIIHRESDTIVNSFFNSNWYKANPQQRKDVISGMIMAQNGTRIRAGLLELSLYTFARILSSTFTLVTVLSSVFD